MTNFLFRARGVREKEPCCDLRIIFALVTDFLTIAGDPEEKLAVKNDQSRVLGLGKILAVR